MSSPGVLILSAPSGAGKTSLARKLVESRQDVGLAVSHTTRPQRPGEADGVDYHFIDKAKFETMIAAGQFIEHATVFGNHYGTSVTAVETLISRGKHAILDIDWQGARNVRHKFPAARSVFVVPPSLAVLEQRLKLRKQDSDEVIASRMRLAMSEFSHKDEYDYIIVNDQFDQAFAELEAILPVVCNSGRGNNRKIALD